jgi:Ni/Co efflux regulator RcnB
MIRRIIVTAILGGALVLAPTAAHADNKGGDNKEARQSDAHRDSRDDGHNNNNNNNNNNNHEAHDRHESGHVDGGDHDRRAYRDHDGRSDDYYNYYGYDDGYYGYYGYRCNGYRDGYYYDRYGRPIYGPDGRPYYRHNPDCDSYYSRYHRYYGDPYCDRYDAASGYCG